MAEKFTSNDAPTPANWSGPSDKGSVMSKQGGRKSVNKATGKDSDDRRNAIDL